MHILLALFAQAENGKQSPGLFGDPMMPFLLLGVFALAYLFLIRPMKQREKRERETLFTSLKKNDEVLTASGIIGIIANIKDDEIVLKVDESSNVRLRVLKSTVVRIMNPKEPAKDAAAAPAGDNVKAGSPPK
ncbi:MAG TPA: preprotein translocase subunit YajC [Gemmataceae bacterium]|nr:preprotein translocase subunit YajC [Gemmataceae bacterium]